MAAPRRVIEISIAATDLIELEAITRSRTEWACRVQRARILLAYRANPSTYAVGEAIGVTHQTVQRCLDRAWSGIRRVYQRIPGFSTDSECDMP